jgi:hypothetical protein
MKKFVFASDRLVNGSIRFKKGIVSEIPKKDITRWVKRGAMEVYKLSVGKSVLDENGDMPKYEDLLVMDGQKEIVKEEPKSVEEVDQIVEDKEIVEDAKPIEEDQKPKRGIRKIRK